MVDIGGMFETGQMIDSDRDKIDIYTNLEEIGVNLQVKVDGVSVGWKNNGHIPELYGSKKAVIMFTCGENIWGFNVAPGESKTVTEAKNHSARAGIKIYHKKIPIIDGTKTNYPVNCIRIFRLEDGHHFKISEVGIAFQNTDGFLTIQDVYEGDCYQDKDSNLICPTFGDGWPSLVDFISQIKTQDGLRLIFPHIANYHPPQPKKTIPNSGGRVKWFNLNLGWGVIETSDGDAYVSYESIMSEDRPRLLKKGDAVIIKNFIFATRHDDTFKRKAQEVKAV